ncbi:MAG: PEP-CTERM sorting domain-containing protein [Acidihalobacter sp.]
MRKALLGLAGSLIGLLCVAAAHATPIETIELKQVYTGYIPDGAAPWLTASVAYGNSGNDLVLTLSSSLSGSDFLQGMQGQNDNGAVGWAFNFVPVGSIANISCDSTLSTNCASKVALGGNYNSGPVPGTFNLAFGWDSGNRFQQGDTAVYDILLNSSETQSLALVALPQQNYIQENNAGWSSVAHIQGIQQSCSGWVVSGSGSIADGGQVCGSRNVPEPSELSVMLFGITLLGGLYLRRRRAA